MTEPSTAREWEVADVRASYPEAVAIIEAQARMDGRAEGIDVAEFSRAQADAELLALREALRHHYATCSQSSCRECLRGAEVLSNTAQAAQDAKSRIEAPLLNMIRGLAELNHYAGTPHEPRYDHHSGDWKNCGQYACREARARALLSEPDLDTDKEVT